MAAKGPGLGHKDQKQGLLLAPAPAFFSVPTLDFWEKQTLLLLPAAWAQASGRFSGPKMTF